MKRITVDLEDVLHERLRKAAFDRHESVSAATRAALEDWLNRREVNDTTQRRRGVTAKAGGEATP